MEANPPVQHPLPACLGILKELVLLGNETPEHGGFGR